MTTAGPNRVISSPTGRLPWLHGNNKIEIELRANAKYFRGKPAIDKVTMYMINEKTTALTMYEQGNLDFMDESHSIPTLDKPRWPSCPSINWCRNCAASITALPSTANPSTTRNCAGLSPLPSIGRFSPKSFKAAILRQLHGFRRACWHIIQRSACPTILKQRAGFWPRLVIPTAKVLPPIVLGYNTQEDHKLVAEAVQAMWQKTLNVVVKIENQEWKVYLKKLQTDPFRGAPRRLGRRLSRPRQLHEVVYFQQRQQSRPLEKSQV